MCGWTSLYVHPVTSRIVQWHERLNLRNYQFRIIHIDMFIWYICYVKRYEKSRANGTRELLKQGQVGRCSHAKYSTSALMECFAWLQWYDECIKWLEELCRAKHPRLTIGHRQSVVARIAGAKTQLKYFVYVVFSASRDERSLVWRETDAAFESRILTSAVVNVDYIEPRFLEDMREIMLERVRDAI